MAPNTVSQQLRVLRQARIVRVRRAGRRAFYALHDAHLVDLLAAIRHHAEHTGT
jgi:DNA-binding transcriptional ArsR family regulator